MTHTQELVDSLRKQYTLNNDGGGLYGKCRVSNKDLLELLRLAEHAEQQNAELKEQSSRLANESVRQAQQNADLCVKNAELLEAMHNIVKADKTKYEYSGSPHARNPAGDLPAIGRRWATPAEIAKEAIAKESK